MLEALRVWRRQLPERVSFRVALPADAVLQQTLPLPETVDTPAARQWLIEDAVTRLFPLSAKELAVDYRVVSRPSEDNAASAHAVVSAARRSEMASFLSALSQVGIVPDAVEAAPCVLRSMAMLAGVNRDSLLLHRGNGRLMWVSPLSDAFRYQQLQDDPDTPTSALWQAQEAYRRLSGCTERGMLLSGEVEASAPLSDAALWSPLVAVHQAHPPLPLEPHRFVLACGLAMREDDR